MGRILSEAGVRFLDGWEPNTPSLSSTAVCDNDHQITLSDPTVGHLVPHERHPMSKRARKRRSRKGNKANHGRKPNA
jgi:hypothetical protein